MSRTRQEVIEHSSLENACFGWTRCARRVFFRAGLRTTQPLLSETSRFGPCADARSSSLVPESAPFCRMPCARSGTWRAGPRTIRETSRLWPCVDASNVARSSSLVPENAPFRRMPCVRSGFWRAGLRTQWMLTMLTATANPSWRA